MARVIFKTTPKTEQVVVESVEGVSFLKPGECLSKTSFAEVRKRLDKEGIDFQLAVDVKIEAPPGQEPDYLFALGIMYAEGKGVPQDDVEAVRNLQKAADYGHPVAQRNVGVAYLFGRGVRKDPKIALAWLRRAADQGNPDAQVDLSAIYALGDPLPKDLVQAHMWLSVAARQGDPETERKLRAVEAHMSATQITEAKRLASDWKPTAKVAPADVHSGFSVHSSRWWEFWKKH
jgi:hypothetical protein